MKSGVNRTATGLGGETMFVNDELSEKAKLCKLVSLRARSLRPSGVSAWHMRLAAGTALREAAACRQRRDPGVAPSGHPSNCIASESSSEECAVMSALERFRIGRPVASGPLGPAGN